MKNIIKIKKPNKNRMCDIGFHVVRDIIVFAKVVLEHGLNGIKGNSEYSK
jgi:hypothetical protein